jgi:hypothetical protein
MSRHIASIDVEARIAVVVVQIVTRRIDRPVTCSQVV